MTPVDLKVEGLDDGESEDRGGVGGESKCLESENVVVVVDCASGFLGSSVKLF